MGADRGAIDGARAFETDLEPVMGVAQVAKQASAGDDVKLAVVVEVAEGRGCVGFPPTECGRLGPVLEMKPALRSPVAEELRTVLIIGRVAEVADASSSAATISTTSSTPAVTVRRL